MHTNNIINVIYHKRVQIMIKINIKLGKFYITIKTKR